MAASHRVIVFIGMLLATAASAWAQPAQPGLGHWTGSLSLPTGELALELDLARAPDGSVIGTVGQPAQQVKGLPLSKVVIQGQSVSFDLPGSGGASFSGTVSADGASLAGNMSNQLGSLPVTFTRTGDAQIAPPPVSPPITKQLEGTWSGTLDAMGRQMRVTLTLTNHPDKTSTGSFTSLDEGGITLPVTIEQHDADVKIDTPATHSSFKGTLDAAGSTLTGTYSQSGLSLPLTFKRDSSK
jgi:uncharacterized protein